ncbi:DUF5684 domain-containing protein [Alistipes sp. OttesenSCG-928-L06]|nr:DUF5684 domain-containing protein [Alistipes sp. OttesenSCG-928-L06]
MMENMYPLFPQVWMSYLMDGIFTLLTISTLVSLWYILKKMGQPGWKGIIPYYNMWAVVRYTGRPMRWFWGLVAGFVCMLLPCVAMMSHLTTAMMTGQIPSEGFVITCAVLSAVLMIVTCVFQILIVHGLSRSFGRGGWFTAGLILLPFIFFPVLAFNDDEFIRPEAQKPLPVPAVVPETAETAEAEITEESVGETE